MTESNYKVVDCRFVSTYLLMQFLSEAAESEGTNENVARLMYGCILRFRLMIDSVRFLLAGLLATNAMWFIHWMGWL